jgi:hypothetical protein
LKRWRKQERAASREGIEVDGGGAGRRMLFPKIRDKERICCQRTQQSLHPKLSTTIEQVVLLTTRMMRAVRRMGRMTMLSLLLLLLMMMVMLKTMKMMIHPWSLLLSIVVVFCCRCCCCFL